MANGWNHYLTKYTYTTKTTRLKIYSYIKRHFIMLYVLSCWKIYVHNTKL